MDEKKIIESCLKGNPKAQRALFDFYAPKLMAVCLRYVSAVQQAEDILQDGFVKIFKKLKDYKFEGSFEGWMRRIMVNTALDELRKEKKFQNTYDVDDYAYKLEDNAFILEELQAEDLMKIIAAMPEGYKLVFNLFAIEGYSHKEIAEMCGFSENNSKSQYLRARSYLKMKLEELKIEREA